MRVSHRPAVNRRRLLTASASAATLAAVSTIARPYLSFAADRPTITHGVQSGDVSVDSGVVWARADRPSRMQVEISTTDSFNVIHQGAYVDALPESDFTASQGAVASPSTTAAAPATATMANDMLNAR